MCVPTGGGQRLRGARPSHVGLKKWKNLPFGATSEGDVRRAMAEHLGASDRRHWGFAGSKRGSVVATAAPRVRPPMAHVRQRRPSHGTSTTTTVAGSMRTGDVAGPLGQRPARRPMVRRSPTYAAVDHESRVVAHVNADVPVALLPQVGTHTPLRYFFSVCVCPRLAPPDRSGAAARTTQLIARKYVPAQASCSRIQGFSAARPLSVEDCGPDAALLHSRRALRRPPALVPPWPLCTRSSQAPSP